jgi:signal peptidase II
VRNKQIALLLFVVVATATGLLDQLSKYLALNHLSSAEAFYLTPFLNFILAYNHGAAFGFLNNESGWQLYLFVGIAVFVFIYLVIHIWREAWQSTLTTVAYGFIAGGAVGNVTDRLQLGYVIDFIDFHIAGWHFWVFNLADCALSVGVGLLLLTIIIELRQRKTVSQ